MKPETPAEGILKHHDWGDSKVYRVTCSCGASDHDHHLWVEADEHDVSVTVYTNVKTNWWSKTRWYHMWQLLIKGYIETEATVCLTEQQAINYAETIKKAIQDVKSFKKSGT